MRVARICPTLLHTATEVHTILVLLASVSRLLARSVISAGVTSAARRLAATFAGAGAGAGAGVVDFEIVTQDLYAS